MIPFHKYYRVIKQTPVYNAVYPYPKEHHAYCSWEEQNMNDICLVIELGTNAIDPRKDVGRRWALLPKYPNQRYGDTSRWLFSEGHLAGCAYGHQDWFANDYDCGDPECGKKWSNSAHQRNMNEFCSNDDGFSVTSLELSVMFAKELRRVITAYIDACDAEEARKEIV